MQKKHMCLYIVFKISSNHMLDCWCFTETDNQKDHILAVQSFKQYTKPFKKKKMLINHDIHRGRQCKCKGKKHAQCWAESEASQLLPLINFCTSTIQIWHSSKVTLICSKSSWVSLLFHPMLLFLLISLSREKRITILITSTWLKSTDSH